MPNIFKVVMRMNKQKNTLAYTKIMRSILLFSSLFFYFAKEIIAGTLVTKNPFLPTDYKKNDISVTRPESQQSGAISKLVEFRGLFTLGNVTHFSLYNKRVNKGYWVSENQSEGGISVGHYDERSKAITVSMNGRTERLTLMNATNTPLPVVASYNQQAVQKVILPSTQNNKSGQQEDNRRVIPRRRVILPKQ